MESRITDIQQESIIEDLISDSVLTELNRSENISDNSVNTVLSFSNSISTNALTASLSTYSMIDPLLDNELGLQGSAIAELLKSSESPAVWALGIAILNNVLNTSTLEADIESVEFLQKTQQANSQRVIDQNNQILDQLNKLIKENGKAYRSGINRQGEISPTPEPPSWWEILLGVILVIAAVAATIMGYGAAVLALMLVSGLAVGILTLVANCGGDGEVLDVLTKIFEHLNIISVFLNLVFDSIEYGMWRAGDLTSEVRNKLVLAKSITNMVINAVVAIAGIIATIAASVAGAAFTGGLSLSGVAAALMMAVNLISSVLTIVNGAFEIAKGVKALKAADIKFVIDMLRNVLEQLKGFMTQIQNDINAIIQHMQGIIENIGNNWTQASELIKSLGETSVNVARSISI